MNDGIRRFLIVDDQEDMTLTMLRILSRFGECACTNSPHEAVEIFKQQLKNESPFDAVFMDIMMPELDGHEAAGAMRQLEKEQAVSAGSETKLIMISSLSDTRTVCKSFFRGGLADGYLTKPICAQTVQDELQKLNLIP